MSVILSEKLSPKNSTPEVLKTYEDNYKLGGIGRNLESLVGEAQPRRETQPRRF